LADARGGAARAVVLPAASTVNGADGNDLGPIGREADAVAGRGTLEPAAQGDQVKMAGSALREPDANLITAASLWREPDGRRVGVYSPGLGNGRELGLRLHVPNDELVPRAGGPVQLDRNRLVAPGCNFIVFDAGCPQMEAIGA